jgi:hypothetical protein
MMNLLRAAVAGTLLLSCPLTHADVVADWNAIALSVVESAERDSTNALRAVAGVHIAMLEAMNFIEARYVPRFLVSTSMPIVASSEAAAVAAAHHVLVHLYPEQSVALDAALEHSLAQIPTGDKKSSGRITGKAIGANVHAIWSAERSGDASPADRVGPTSEALMWNSIAAKLIAARRLTSIEAARIHALISIAASDVYAAAKEDLDSRGQDQACAPCAAGVATLVIVESEFGSPDRPTHAMTHRPDDTAEPSFRKVDDGAFLRTSVASNEEIGKTMGARALTYYRSAK